jgi:hypothetical protein
LSHVEKKPLAYCTPILRSEVSERILIFVGLGPEHQAQ